MNPVSLTVTPPTRVVALVGALVLTGLAAVFFMFGRGAIGGSATPTGSAQVTHGITPTAHKPATKPKPATRQPSGFPAPVDHALRYGKVVVVSVSMPGAAVDAQVRREAHTAAAASHAGFVRLSALNERAMAQLVVKTGVLPDPAVVVVRRPDTVIATFSVADAGTIAQAVAEARR
jgi:hypothetical protein